MATGNIDGYQQALQNIPGSVATQMGFSVSDYESNEILTAHQAHLDAIAAAKAEHNQTMNDLDDQRKQDADEARQDMRDSLTTEEELQQKRQEIRDKYADKAEDLKLDYAQQIGKTLFAKGLSQKEVTTFLQNEMPAALAEVERINANLKRNLESGMAPEAAAVQWAYAMDASQYADLTGKEGGKVGDSIETQIDDLKTATETKITAMQDAWDTYKTTLTQDIPQWYKDSKTKILTSHAQQVADLKAQLTDLTEAEQQALMDIAIAHGQFLARYDLDMQQSMRNLVRSGVEGDAFYRQYAQLTAQAGEVLDMSTRTREQQTADIVTGSRPTFAAPTLVIDTITLSVDGKTFTGFVEDISTRVLEEDYEDSVKNGAMRRR
jgi:ribosome-binding protein aMBF1 (putative translation factor)